MISLALFFIKFLSSHSSRFSASYGLVLYSRNNIAYFLLPIFFMGVVISESSYSVAFFAMKIFFAKNSSFFTVLTFKTNITHLYD